MYFGLAVEKSTLQLGPVACTYHRELAIGDTIFLGDEPLMVMSKQRSGRVWEYLMHPMPVDVANAHQC